LVNDAFCKLFGLSRDDIIGKTLAEDVTPEERGHFLEKELAKVRLKMAEKLQDISKGGK